jgi:hypothetical protein
LARREGVTPPSERALLGRRAKLQTFGAQSDAAKLFFNDVSRQREIAAHRHLLDRALFFLAELVPSVFRHFPGLTKSAGLYSSRASRIARWSSQDRERQLRRPLWRAQQRKHTHPGGPINCCTKYDDFLRSTGREVCFQSHSLRQSNCFCLEIWPAFSFTHTAQHIESK